MQEIWKSVKGYEGLYEVSNLGRVKSLDRITKYTKYYGDTAVDAVHHFKGRILRPGINGGYQSVILTKDSVSRDHLVHRLVALAFVDNDDIEHKTQVDHIDNDRCNNCADNLCWVTPKENQKRAIQRGTHTTCNPYRTKKIIDEDTGKIFDSMSDAENFYNIPKGRISGAIRSNQRVYGHKFKLFEPHSKSLICK